MVDSNGEPVTEFPNDLCYCSVECYQGVPAKPQRKNIETRPVAADTSDLVGKSVAFCPDKEEWMKKKEYEGVASSYLVGIVARAHKKPRARSITQGMYQVRWWNTRFQSKDHVHIIDEEKVREGIVNYEQMNGTLMRGETWKALCKTARSECVVEGIDDLQELDEDLVRFDRSADVPQCQEEVEKMEEMNFEPNAWMSEPSDLFTHPDGTTGAKLKEEYRYIFEHSASSCFFAYLPLSFWRKVLENTNVEAVAQKEKIISLDELMMWLGIMFYMAIVKKGEYANYWGNETDARIFGITNTDMNSKACH